MKYIINGFSVPKTDFWVRINGIATEQQRYMLLEGREINVCGRVCRIVDDDDEDEIKNLDLPIES